LFFSAQTHRRRLYGIITDTVHWVIIRATKVYPPTEVDLFASTSGTDDYIAMQKRYKEKSSGSYGGIVFELSEMTKYPHGNHRAPMIICWLAYILLNLNELKLKASAYYIDFPKKREDGSLWAISGLKFLLHERIGSGKHSQVFGGFNTHSGNVCIKLEDMRAMSQVSNEVEVLRALHASGVTPNLIANGTANGINVFVTQPIGIPLRFLVNQYGPPSDVQRWYKSLTQSLATIHKLGYIFRDIHPNNIIVKQDENPQFIDYGFATPSTVDNDDSLIFECVGVEDFLSHFAILSMTQTARDDRISLIYSMLYCLMGYLPWQGEKTNKQVKMKKSISNHVKLSSIASKILLDEYSQLLTTSE